MASTIITDSSDYTQGIRNLSIVILNWDGLHLLKKCLPALELSIDQADIRDTTEVIVVDQTSKDGSVDYAKETLKGFHSIIEVLQEYKNFSQANNIGIKLANPKNDILLINNDIYMLNDTLYHLVHTPYPNNWGIVSGAIFSEAGIPLHTGKTINLKTGEGGYLRYFDQPSITPIQAAEGCFQYINRELINKIGLLNEDYALYYQDMEYCILAWKANFQVLFNPTVRFKHGVSQTITAKGDEYPKHYDDRQQFIKRMKELNLTS